MGFHTFSRLSDLVEMPHQSPLRGSILITTPEKLSKGKNLNEEFQQLTGIKRPHNQRELFPIPGSE
jgi:hypothetical protein